MDPNMFDDLPKFILGCVIATAITALAIGFVVGRLIR